MRVDRESLRKIMLEEIKLINEGGCGCGCKGMPGGCGDTSYDTYDGYSEDHGHHDEISDHVSNTEFLTRDESLKSVVAIAMSTSCPITRESLLNLVKELM